MSLYMDWEDFDEFVDFNVKVETIDKKSDLMPTLIKRRLKFGFYSDNFMDYDDSVDEKGNLDYFSKRSMSLYCPIRQMFHEKWPDKYILLPIDIESDGEKEKIMRLMKKGE